MKKKAARKAKAVRSKAMVVSPVERAFDEIVELIRAARQQAARSVNTELIELYWRIGDYLHRKIESDGWAKGTVVQLAAYIAQREPGLRGFSPQNLWRMRQFFVAYRDFPRLSPLLRELPWSSHLHILSRSKRPDEREFYLRKATQNRWPVREVARQLDGALFESAVLSPPKLSTALRELHPAAARHFKDAYLTLTGYNAEYSDRPFAEKRDMAGGFKQSPLKLNAGLGQLVSWNEAAIQERAGRLADLIRWPCGLRPGSMRKPLPPTSRGRCQ